MKIQTKITASEIRNLGLTKETVLGFDFIWDGENENNFLCADGKRILSFDTGKNRRLAYDKIRRMNLGWGWVAPQLTDEEEGIIEASKNGENPFAYSIICADPSQNGIFK